MYMSLTDDTHASVLLAFLTEFVAMLAAAPSGLFGVVKRSIMN